MFLICFIDDVIDEGANDFILDDTDYDTVHDGVDDGVDDGVML
tara:strand:- start:667 stop:795 length:129 start_codon:yes stop_codon:yes gene_type:complete